MKKVKIQKNSEKDVANFLFEVGMLAKTPRSGFHLLGTGRQSVAEHTSRVSFIGYALALLDGKVDTLKVLKMCLLHDITETRISDLNHIHQKYAERKEHNAIKDITDSVPFGKDMFEILAEYEKRQSAESILAKDADNLEWIISLKEEADAGNIRAEKWARSAIKRLKTPYAKSIVKEIMKTNSNAWWYGNKKVTI
jgi:putative hydrolase of HD superfamily